MPTDDNTELALFADDLAIISSAKRVDLANVRMQGHLLEVAGYVKTSKMHLINFTKKSQPQVEYNRSQQHTDTRGNSLEVSISMFRQKTSHPKYKNNSDQSDQVNISIFGRYFATY